MIAIGEIPGDSILWCNERRFIVSLSFFVVLLVDGTQFYRFTWIKRFGHRDGQIMVAAPTFRSGRSINIAFALHVRNDVLGQWYGLCRQGGVSACVSCQESCHVFLRHTHAHK